jgi:DUF4097 and DUF4098 domain-containing protein YvlB
MNRLLELRSLTLVAFSTLLVGTLAVAETRDEPTQTFPLQAGGLLSLENIDGDVTIEGWKNNEVSISAVKQGESDDLDRMNIVIEATADRVHIKTEYPIFRGSSGSVDYAIKAPSSAILGDIELVNGNLTITSITGRVALRTVNGTITATGLTDSAEIETVNGELDVSFEKMSGEQSVDIESVNGPILIRIPSKANADVDAETLNGDISNEFGLTVERGRWIGSSMEGRLGSGGARIGLESVNGSIDIKSR